MQRFPESLRCLAVVLTAVVLAGCNGGTVDRHALTNDAATIGSINCEAWLLARAVARDRVTANVHARAGRCAASAGGEPGRRAGHAADRRRARGAVSGPKARRCDPRAEVEPPAGRVRQARSTAVCLPAVQAGGPLLVSKLLSLALGILAAIGGFVDIGDLVFNTAAGATFGYQLMWVIPVGVVGIIVYSEMCGRVAAVSGQGGVRRRARANRLLGGLGRARVVGDRQPADAGRRGRWRRDRAPAALRAALPLLIVLAIVGLAVMIWTVKLDWIERIFGYGGLCMLVFAVAAVKLGPDWGKVGSGFIPHLSQNNPVLYVYFVVGLLGAAMTPYEVYFYSSGGVEDRWTTKDLGLNRANAIVGYSLGGFLSLALMIVGGAVFLRHGINPEHLGTIALGSEEPLGKIGLLLALVGILFAVGGASIDTVFAGAYNLAQFFGWEWGRYRHPSGAPRFALTWLVLLVAGARRS